jgi:maltose alpha-D-glucosyltransferase / alpha-amylase
MMPFYPSPLGDDGYDITDYYAVDPRFGTLGDFVEMIRTADNLGIRVLVDLVMSHTSNQHPWFQRSRHDRDSRYRDYYRWSDKKQGEPSEVAFPGEQTSTWTYDDVAGQWYMHRYYDFMPDLNITDPDVLDEMHKVLGFWLELGISGFRVDSLPFMIETIGTSAKDQPVTYLRSLVEFLERRRGDAIFLGEANVSPQDQQHYFAVDGGDGVQMLFDFRTCAAQWLAHARGRAEPLIDALHSRPRHPAQAQFANFCRHHDELNLGLLSDSECEEVFAAFAPEPEHRVYGRGIRRRLAPMLDHDQQRIRLVLALTMALPARLSCCTETRSAWARTCRCPDDSRCATRCSGRPGTPAASLPATSCTGRSTPRGRSAIAWSTWPTSAMTPTRCTPGWLRSSGCAARARNSDGANGAHSTSVTRACWPSRPAGASTR